MTKISMTYNPLTWCPKGAELEVDDLKYEVDSSCDGQIQLWFEPFLKKVMTDFPTDNYEIYFTGTRLDFNDIKQISDKLIKTRAREGEKITIQCLLEKEKKLKAMDVLKNLIDFMKETDFTEKNNLNDLLSTLKDKEIKIALLATFSAGKSTLINALLSKRILPARNSATTARVVEIIDNDQPGYRLKLRGKDKTDFTEEIFTENEQQELYERMEELNKDETIDDLKLYMDIPWVNLENHGEVHLFDTPGPNNATDPIHEVKTMALVQDDEVDLYFYILDATVVTTDDSRQLLETVCDKIKKKGITAADKVIFLLNKFDELDPEIDKLAVHEDILHFLKERKIPYFTMIPISAKASILSTLKNTNQYLTRKEQKDLRGFSDKEGGLFCTEFQNLIKKMLHASPEIKRDTIDRTEACLQKESNMDETNCMDTFSGMHTLKQFVRVYLNKYWAVMCIRGIVPTLKETFSKELEKKKIFLELAQKKPENAIKEIEYQLNEIETLLEDKNFSESWDKKVRDEIGKQKEILCMNFPPLMEFEKQCKELFEEQFGNNSNIPLDEYKELKKELDYQIKKLMSKLPQELEEYALQEAPPRITKIKEELMKGFKTELGKAMERIPFVESSISISFPKKKIKIEPETSAYFWRSVLTWFNSYSGDELIKVKLNKTREKFILKLEDILHGEDRNAGLQEKIRASIGKGFEEVAQNNIQKWTKALRQSIQNAKKQQQELLSNREDLQKKRKEIQTEIENLHSEKTRFERILEGEIG